MPYYLIENFNAGLDLRKASEVAPAGSLRVLNNAVINAGGEIEKRKAFVKNTALTAYGQAYQGEVVGPVEVPGVEGTAFFRHHASGDPAGWTQGDGLSGSSNASYIDQGDGLAAFRFWASEITNSSIRLSNPTLLHARTAHEFGAGDYPGYLVDDFVGKVYTVDGYYNGSLTFKALHFLQYMLAETGEPFIFDPNSGQWGGRHAQVTLKDKSYVIRGDVLMASAIGEPMNFSDLGSGQLRLSSQGISIGVPTMLALYYGQLAVFGTRGVQFYDVDADFAQNQFLRTVATSLFAPRTVIGYGDGDIIYLSRTGIRSMSARDSSNLAITTDIGSPIDDLIRDALKYDSSQAESTGGTTTPHADFYSLAMSLVYPMTGEYWLFLKEKIYVLSRHEGASVMAWSTFDLPEPATANLSTINGAVKSRWCADACEVGDTVVMRNFCDEMFLFGGTDGETYDESEVEVITPFMDMERPGDNKYFTGLDVVCQGEWDVEVCTNPQPEGVPLEWEKVAQVDGTTRQQVRIPLNHQGMQIALRLTSRSPLRALLSQVAIFFDRGEQK